MFVNGFLDLKFILQFTEGVQWFCCREKLCFFKGIRGGPTLREVQLFTGGGDPNANFYEIDITCDFPGSGSVPHIPPLDPHMNDING